MPRQLGTSTLTVLAAVAEGSRYGFDVMDVSGLASGTVYRALGRLEELGLVASEWEEAATALAERRPRRRYYVLTTEGARQLAAARKRLAALVGGGVPRSIEDGGA